MSAQASPQPRPAEVSASPAAPSAQAAPGVVPPPPPQVPPALEAAVREAQAAAAQPGADGAEAVWNCRAQVAGPDEAPGEVLREPLTVGQKFVLSCEGAPLSLNLDKAALRLALPKEEKYKLKLLRVQELREDGATLTVTSYRVGKNELKNAVLTDGSRKVALSGPGFELQSVVNPQENPEGKLIPPPAPLNVNWPVWLWGGLTAVLLTGLVVAVVRGRRSLQRKRWLAELARHGTALTPYHQFNKDLRALGRQASTFRPETWNAQAAGSYIDELNRAFRWYLAREFTVPAHEWSPSAIAAEIRKRDHGVHKRVGRDLNVALRELNKAMAAKEKLSYVDSQQILEICRKVADEVRRGRGEVRR